MTVITATYNRPDTLRLAIQSVLRQTWAAFEYWVVGDGCDARTAAVIAEFDDPRLHYFNRETNSGAPSRPHNEALARSTGELVAYLSHDDLWLPWHLEALVAEQERTGAALVYSLSARIGPDGVTDCAGAHDDLADLNAVSCPPSSWLIQRSALVAVGGWRDPDLLPYPIDLDLLVRLEQAGQSKVCLPRLTLLFFAAGLFPDAYRRGAEAQWPYAQELRTSPAALERRLLTAIALLEAEHRCPKLGWAGLLRRAAGLVCGAAVKLYGRERWPVGPIRLARARRARQRRDARRGLGPR